MFFSSINSGHLTKVAIFCGDFMRENIIFYYSATVSIRRMQKVSQFFFLLVPNKNLRFFWIWVKFCSMATYKKSLHIIMY